jgi:hypothetical protein
MTRLANLAASVRQRLLNGARDRGEQFELTLVRFASERLLYRLSVTKHADRFVLKGGTLFLVWAEHSYRPTRDVDLLGFGAFDEASLRSMFTDVCGVEVAPDGLLLDPQSITVEPIRDAQEYVGLRVQLEATLGTVRIPLQVDVGFGDAVSPPPETCEVPGLLDQPRARLRAYRRETVIAEKLHAMVVHGVLNSRMKDFHDVWWLGGASAFDGGLLAGAIRATFDRRSTPIGGDLPVALTADFFVDAARERLWRLFVERQGAPLTGNAMERDFRHVGERLRRFLLPPWRALETARVFSGSWPPGGPWSEMPSGG